MSDTDSYVDWLKALGWINEGDCVYVISDMLELAKISRERGRQLVLENVIEGLQEMVGETGTLLFPTFNWDFCSGAAFDYHKTPVHTGALPKAALRRKEFARTLHPIYSFAVWGAHKNELRSINSKDSFGPGTIFEKMFQWDCKALAIGLPALKGNTYIHHVEQTVGVPYRYSKEFTGDYIDETGVKRASVYRMYVRDLKMNPRHIDGFRPLEDKMRREGLIQTDFYESMASHLMRIVDLDCAVRRDILENDSRNMYVYNPLIN